MKSNYLCGLCFENYFVPTCKDDCKCLCHQPPRMVSDQQFVSSLIQEGSLSEDAGMRLLFPEEADKMYNVGKNWP